MLTVRHILEHIKYDSRSWPQIFRHTPSGEEEASVPEALYSAVENIDLAEKTFAKLADEYIPRGREDDVTKVIRCLNQAKGEVRTSRVVIETLGKSVFRPWRPKPKDES